MHETLMNELSVKTRVMQFYLWLSRGFFLEEETKEIYRLNDDNVAKIELMIGSNWDGDYGFIFTLIPQTNAVIEKAKSFLSYKQIAPDEEIAAYIQNNPSFFQLGIDLKSLRKLLDIEVMFRNGYMLHDVFMGYPEKSMYAFQVDCLDYVHSAAHFYNEGYDYYHNKKQIKTYDQIPHEEVGCFEFRRIQPKEEVMFRNFREAYINIIFFIETFINSVGYDAFLSGTITDERSLNKLRGIQGVRKNGRLSYSTMSNKLTDIPKIINNTEMDLAKEPFASYLNQDVELRNQYVHSSPDKIKPLFGPEDWKQKCDELIAGKSHSILNSFWKACYPSKPFPGNIFNVFHGNSFKGHRGAMVQSRE